MDNRYVSEPEVEWAPTNNNVTQDYSHYSLLNWKDRVISSDGC